MNRPYIFCHMLPSLDGKIMGSYMGLSTDKAISFTLLGAEAKEGSSLWLRYRVNHEN